MKDISLYETVPPLKNNFTVKFRLYRKQGTLLPHWHEHIELLFFTSGECTFISGGESFDVCEGDLVVVNGTEIHSFATHRPTEYFCILIYPSFFSDVDFSSVRFKNLIRADNYIKECFDNIYAEYRSSALGSDMMQKSHTYRLVAYLMRNYTAEQMTERDMELHSRSLERLHSVTEYVAENYGKKITTESLAKMCYLSEGHFCRFFKSVTGKSSIEYVNEYRIEKAAVMLAETNESISEIATRVGFEDINYFSRTFKKIKQTSPSEYRKERNK